MRRAGGAARPGARLTVSEGLQARTGGQAGDTGRYGSAAVSPALAGILANGWLTLLGSGGHRLESGAERRSLQYGGAVCLGGSGNCEMRPVLNRWEFVLALGKSAGTIPAPVRQLVDL